MQRRTPSCYVPDDGTNAFKAADVVDPAWLAWQFLEDLAPLDCDESSVDRPTTHQRLALLGLPRELRDLIYSHIFDIRKNVPERPERAEPRHIVSGLRYTGLDVAYDSSIAENTVAILLQVCRQLRRELIEHAESSQKTGKITAELDIMSGPLQLFPTWIVFPALISGSSTLDLTVHLRIFGQPHFRDLEEDLKLPSRFRGFLSLIGHLLHCKPILADQAGHSGDGVHKLAVDTLHLIVSGKKGLVRRTFDNMSHSSRTLSWQTDDWKWLRRIHISTAGKLICDWNPNAQVYDIYDPAKASPHE